MEKFQDIVYQRSDFEQLINRFGEQLDRFDSATDAQTARQALLDLQTMQAEASTQMSIAHIRNTADLTDVFYDQEMACINQNAPGLIPIQIRLFRSLLSSPFRSSLESAYGKQIFAVAAAELKAQDETIIKDRVEEAMLGQAYQKLTASLRTTFDGEPVNYYGLVRHLEHPDREHRRRAYQAWAELCAGHAGQLDEIYDRLVAVRVRMAGKLGFANYTQLAYLTRHRLDYGPADVAAFRQQVRDVVVPACVRLREHQGRRIGVDKLRYYDETILFADGNPAPSGDVSWKLKQATAMYAGLSPETAEFFRFMTDYELFDLDTRPGKRMGGYCTALHSMRMPFIFANCNGTAGDIAVLTHEAGHALAYYQAARTQELAEYCHAGSEIGEIHSMSMEFFTLPWMELFFGDRAVDYRFQHLFQSLTVLPYMACVDEFQHEVFARPTMTAGDRRDVWRQLERIYMPWRDYEDEPFFTSGGFWMQKQHIFLYPFYYIDYALAQMGAFEFYRRMKSDPAAAWQDYLALCRAGGSKSYRDLLALAGLSDPFAPGSVAGAVGHIIEELESWPDAAKDG